jgi:hypothetical protein
MLLLETVAFVVSVLGVWLTAATGHPRGIGRAPWGGGEARSTDETE